MKEREVWIDNIKVIACILVVLGHFFQSMTKAGILPVTDLYNWFNQTIYLFHVPLFFICSGYLYQKYAKINDMKSWVQSVYKKFFALAIPYFIFTIITVMLKQIFLSSVNQMEAGLLETLFVHPTAPYWYLYVLFFIFLFTPNVSKKQTLYIATIIGIALKIVIVCSEIGSYLPYAVSGLMNYCIYFIGGMALEYLQWHKKINKQFMFSGVAFIIGSIFIYFQNINNGILNLVLSVLACVSITLVCYYNFNNVEGGYVFLILSKYTLPIFLMHTIFAAGWRSILLKFGIQKAIVHVVTGLVISIVGPIIVAKIIGKTKYLNWILYPDKYLDKREK